MFLHSLRSLGDVTAPANGLGEYGGTDPLVGRSNGNW